MSETFEERRRAPRMPVQTHPAAQPHVALPLTVPVEVLDISEGGVLVRAADPLEPSRRCRLRILLGHERIVADVTVARCAPLTSGTDGFRIAAAFIEMPDESRRILSRFLHQKGN